jgi:peptidyl-prolyl cis-trans isomerase A (cyclophilin A)
MLHRFALLFVALLLPAAAAAQATTNVVVDTTEGRFVVAVEIERAPVTAANFLRYVEDKRFDGTVFYRAMRNTWGDQPNGLIQGGTQFDPARILPPIAHEPTSQTGLSHTTGALSMARYAPGTATGDFSIMVSDQTGLDANPRAEDPDGQAGYAVFGRVIEGMEVVRAIFAAPTDPDKGEGFMRGQLLADPVRIVSARRAPAN